MRRERSIRFEALEGRLLLSHGHPGAGHHHRVAAKTPLDVSGTLTVDNKAVTSNMNPDGTTTTSAPVVGQVAGLGQVRGLWNETTDSSGSISGADTIQLRNGRGMVVIGFNNQIHGRPHRTSSGAVYYQHNQRILSGSGAYARSRETGTIQLTTNTAHTHVESITLQSTNA